MSGDFQLVGYIRLLAEHDVDYLIVGGVGSRLQGAAVTTQDLDIMPDPAPENLDRLATALSTGTTRKKSFSSTSYEPHHVVDALEFKTETVLSFQTSYGVIDVLMELPGVGFFGDVHPNAKRYEFGRSILIVANLDDIITSKQTADRTKDLRSMDALYEARERLRTQGDNFEVAPETIHGVTGAPDQTNDK